MDQLAIVPAALAEMIRLIEDTTISGKIAKDILPELLEGKGNGGVKVRDGRQSADGGAWVTPAVGVYREVLPHPGKEGCFCCGWPSDGLPD